jgi:DNA-binding winged helix-turn-helix (wHTH) protein
MSQGVQAEKVRFGVFEADLRAGELRKHGIRIHLQRQPFRILAALLERPGDLVSRDDLRFLIWGSETVVDFDHSLGTAINKLREALHDSADSPLYIETLAKRGFRFIAPVETIVPPAAEPEKYVADPVPTAPAEAHLRPRIALLAAAAAVTLAAVGLLAIGQRRAPSGVLRFKIRFTVLDPKTRAPGLWEVAADGRNPHPMPAGWSTPSAECCGDWTADGSDFLFQSAHGGRPNVWGIHEAALWHRASTPFEVTSGPLDFFAPVPSPRGEQVFSIGANTRRELFHFNPTTQKAEPYLTNVRSARRSAHAHRSDRIAWISTTDGTLWRGKEDGSERVQLIGPPSEVYMERWSPDDRRILVMARQPGTAYRIYTVSSDGGDFQPLLEESRNQADPDWVPDGRSVVFGPPDYAAEATAPKDIRIGDLDTRKVSVVPESTGMFSPRWSPDGRYIAAMTLDQHRLMVFDRNSDKWSTVAEGLIHNPVVVA